MLLPQLRSFTLTIAIFYETNYIIFAAFTMENEGPNKQAKYMDLDKICRKKIQYIVNFFKLIGFFFTKCKTIKGFVRRL